LRYSRETVVHFCSDGLKFQTIHLPARAG